MQNKEVEKWDAVAPDFIDFQFNKRPKGHIAHHKIISLQQSSLSKATYACLHWLKRNSKKQTSKHFPP